MVKTLILFTLIGFFGQLLSASAEKKIICYVGSWAYYRPGPGKFEIAHIDPNLCTHLIYTFAKLEENEIKAFDPYLDLKENWGIGQYDKLYQLKSTHIHLKILIAIGGWNEGSTKYSEMAAFPSTRSKFIKSVINFLIAYKFDGIDIDWEYPAQRGGDPEDKKNYALLLKELSAALHPWNYLLSIAVPAGVRNIDTGFDVPTVSKYVDFINVLSYDLHGSWESSTGHNAPINARPSEDKKLSVIFVINYWLEKGADPSKIMLGIPFYGRTFTISHFSKDPIQNSIGPGIAGKLTQQSGTLGYNEICMEIINGLEVIRDPIWQAPYAVRQDMTWIGFDDIDSVHIKAQLILSKSLGGAMIWSIETDDFRGDCGNGKYPLLRRVNQILSNKNTPEITSSKLIQIPSIIQPSVYQSTIMPTSSLLPSVFPSPSSTLSSFSSTSSSIIPLNTNTIKHEFYCVKDGYFTNPYDCESFVRCVDSGNRFEAYNFKCPDGTSFDETFGACVPSNIANCKT